MRGYASSTRRMIRDRECRTGGGASYDYTALRWAVAWIANVPGVYAGASTLPDGLGWIEQALGEWPEQVGAVLESARGWFVQHAGVPIAR